MKKMHGKDNTSSGPINTANPRAYTHSKEASDHGNRSQVGISGGHRCKNGRASRVWLMGYEANTYTPRGGLDELFKAKETTKKFHHNQLSLENEVLIVLDCLASTRMLECGSYAY